MRDRGDRELVESFLRTRDDAVFRALYRRHTPALYAMACRLAGEGASGRASPDELVEEAWVRAVRFFGDFEWRSELRTWLIGILINCHREAIRGRARDEPPTISILSTESRAEPVAPHAPAGMALELEQGLARLPDGYREVVVLYHVYGYKHREIAERLGISEGTSKSQLARGLTRLREILS